MKKSFSVMILLQLGLTSVPVWSSIPTMEDWYMNRGRSNLEIGNYKAAIEAYEKVVDRDSSNKEAMRSLGVAYEKQGMKDQAIAQYDKYLAKNPEDSEIAFHQADTLGWSRYSYRRKDALKYYQMGLAKKNSIPMRLKYARLLASNQETSPEAIRQYQIVLRSSPNSPEAHQGLAKAYAWNGENDLALYHAGIAERYGASTSDLDKLERDLNKGREPALSADFNFIDQPGDNYGLAGFQLTALARKDLSPFITGSARAGFEDYWHGTDNLSGGLFSIGMEYRPNETRRFYGELGYHTIQPLTSILTSQTTSAGPENLVFKFEYQVQNGGFEVTPGFERSIRSDSLLSLAGSKLYGTGLGEARSNLLYTLLKFEAASFDFKIKPYFGWISALTVPANAALGLDFSLEHEILKHRDFSLLFEHEIQLSHYGNDQSAFTGNGAGYFSPQFFMNQSPHLKAVFSIDDGQNLEASAGPAIQYVNDIAIPGGWLVGADVHLDYLARFSKHVYWKLDAGYMNIADAYSQLQIENMLTYTF